MASSSAQPQKRTSYRRIMFLATVVGVLIGIGVQTPLQDMTMPTEETFSKLWPLVGGIAFFLQLAAIAYLVKGVAKYHFERNRLQELLDAPGKSGYSDEQLETLSHEIFEDVVHHCEKVKAWAPRIGFLGTGIGMVKWSGILTAGNAGSIDEVVVGICSTIIGVVVWLLTDICQALIENAEKRRNRNGLLIT